MNTKHKFSAWASTLAIAACACIGTSLVADAEIINIDARAYGDPGSGQPTLPVTFEGGYRYTFSRVSTPGPGVLYPNGWEFNGPGSEHLTYWAANVTLKNWWGIGTNTQSFRGDPSFSLTLANPNDSALVNFFITDYLLSDNSGGVSISVVREYLGVPRSVEAIGSVASVSSTGTTSWDGETLTLATGSPVWATLACNNSAVAPAAIVFDTSFLTTAASSFRVLVDGKEIMSRELATTIPGEGDEYWVPLPADLLAGVHEFKFALDSLTAEPSSVSISNIRFLSASSGISYATWALANGVSSDPHLDSDKDGQSNLLEYAFGGDPRVADASAACPMPKVSAGKLQIRFKCDADCTDISYTVQASEALGSGAWTDIARSTGGAAVVPIGTLSEVTDSGTGQRTATVTASTEVFPAGQGFLRVKISE